MIFSIKLFWKYDNDIKLFKQATTIIHHDCNCNFFCYWSMRSDMKEEKALFVYLNPEKDDSVEDISGINMLYKDSTSKLIFDSYSFLALSFVNGGENRWLRLLNNIYSQFFRLLLFLLVLCFFI